MKDRRGIAVAAVVAVAGFACVGTARADVPSPIDYGVLGRGFALPQVGRPQVLEGGRSWNRLDVNVTNDYWFRGNPTEQLTLDGETTQIAWTSRKGLGNGWDIGAFVPLLVQGGGFLDTVIQHWHRIWNLPNGGREQAANDQIHYRYTRNGATLLDVERSSSGIGDLQLELGRQLAGDLAARAMLKVPTGSSSTLAGNGAWGGALWLDIGPRLESGVLRGNLSAGISYTGTGDILRGQQEHWIPFGALGFGLRLTDHLLIQLQLNGHAPLYRDSELAPLVHVGAPLSVSAVYAFSKSTALTVGFQEKANFGASPDFGIHLGLAF